VEGLRRDPVAAGTAEYDLIVIGGGIYGAMLTLESARRGLRPLLVERDDFGSATSWNSHRIVHGGLRYLQRLDLGRFRASVRERSWFLRHFPDLVEPLPCLMPLYGQGARRPEILRAALAMNALLSRRRNDGLRSDRRLASGGVTTVPETVSLFPGVRQDKLRGGALWYDAVMNDSQRLLIETLRWACDRGARCLNYVEATGLKTAAGSVTGITATDRESDQPLSFAAPRVVNCAGPWSRELAGGFDRDVADLFTPSLAFNLLFDREPPAEVALAISAPVPGAHTWFLYPRRGRVYAGTSHVPCAEVGRNPEPTREQVDAAIAGINAAAPGLDLRRHQVLRIYTGLLPAAEEGSADLSVRPIIHDHGEAGGPKGLISTSGVKYTTARDVAEQTLRRAFDTLPEIEDDADRPEPATPPNLDSLESDDEAAQAELGQALRDFTESEAVIHIDDLLLRRGTWGEDPAQTRALATQICRLLDWDVESELARLD